MQVWPGNAYPLGATFDGTGTNFALFSEVAEKVELCLFDDDRVESRIELTEVDGYVWHVYLPEVQPGQRYGYRVHGPWDPDDGLRCNPNKLLLDPYAKATCDDIRWGQPMFSYQFDDPDERNDDDSAVEHAARRRRRTRSSTGPAIARPRSRTRRRSSTRRTSRASRSCTPTSPRSCAAPTPPSRTRRSSSTSSASASPRSS